MRRNKKSSLKLPFLGDGADYYKNLIESQHNNVNEGNSKLSDEEQLNG